MPVHSLSAFRNRIARSSGLGLSSAKSACVFQTHALSLPALGFSSIKGVTERKALKDVQSTIANVFHTSLHKSQRRQAAGYVKHLTWNYFGINTTQGCSYIFFLTLTNKIMQGHYCVREYWIHYCWEKELELIFASNRWLWYQEMQSLSTALRCRQMI